MHIVEIHLEGLERPLRAGFNTAEASERFRLSIDECATNRVAPPSRYFEDDTGVKFSFKLTALVAIVCYGSKEK